MPSQRNTPPAINLSNSVAAGAPLGGLASQCHILAARPGRF
jgi:hypothetical protein